MSNQNILEALSDNSLLECTVQALENNRNELERLLQQERRKRPDRFVCHPEKLDVSRILKQLARCKYTEKEFKRRHGDACVLGPSNSYKLFSEGWRYQIRLDPALHSKPDEYKDVLLHELAHILEWIIYSNMSHSPKWKEICRTIGATPKACSTRIPEERKAKAKEIWKCKGCAKEIPRFRKSKYHPSRYRCPKCKNGFEVIAN